jgi:hypothetical protein
MALIHLGENSWANAGAELGNGSMCDFRYAGKADAPCSRAHLL